MNKRLRNISMIVPSLLITASASAGFVIKIPLEVPQGGSLPENTIIIGSKANEEPIFDIPDPLPTDSDVVCEYDLTKPSAFLSGLTRDGGDTWSSYQDAYYQGQRVINAFKGQEMFHQNDGDFNLGYYEVCIKGEPLYSNQNNDVPNQEWDQDDCRFDKDFYGIEYNWITVPTSDGRMAFSSASLGSFGNVTANSTNITFPAGTITVPEGKILPEENQRIIMGKTAFNKGNYNGNRYVDGQYMQNEYAVCKKTAK